MILPELRRDPDTNNRNRQMSSVSCCGSGGMKAITCPFLVDVFDYGATQPLPHGPQ